MNTSVLLYSILCFSVYNYRDVAKANNKYLVQNVNLSNLEMPGHIMSWVLFPCTSLLWFRLQAECTTPTSLVLWMLQYPRCQGPGTCSPSQCLSRAIRWLGKFIFQGSWLGGFCHSRVLGIQQDLPSLEKRLMDSKLQTRLNTGW